MCAKKNANLDFWLTIWLSFERRKIFLETVLHMLERERERDVAGWCFSFSLVKCYLSSKCVCGGRGASEHVCVCVGGGLCLCLWFCCVHANVSEWVCAFVSMYVRERVLMRMSVCICVCGGGGGGGEVLFQRQAYWNSQWQVYCHANEVTMLLV